MSGDERAPSRRDKLAGASDRANESKPSGGRHGPPPPDMDGASRGSVREGMCLGLLLHLGIQSFYAFAFVRLLHLEVGAALELALTIGGATQMPYMIPAIVDARVMRNRALTARGLAVVAMGVVCTSLWCLAF